MEYDTDTIQQFERMVYTVAWKYTNDPSLWKDLVQEGFEGLREACNTYDPSFDTKFSTWAYNRIDRWIRHYTEYDVDTVHVPPGRPPVTMVDLEEARWLGDAPAPCFRELREALDAIDPDMAEILVLHYCDGHTKRELADDRGINYFTLVARMNRALANLRKELGA